MVAKLCNNQYISKYFYTFMRELSAEWHTFMREVWVEWHNFMRELWARSNIGELVKMDFPRVWHPFGGQTRGSCRALRGLCLSEW